MRDLVHLNEGGMLMVRCSKSMARFAFSNMGGGGEMGLWLGDLY